MNFFIVARYRLAQHEKYMRWNAKIKNILVDLYFDFNHGIAWATINFFFKCEGVPN